MKIYTLLGVQNYDDYVIDDKFVLGCYSSELKAEEARDKYIKNLDTSRDLIFDWYHIRCDELDAEVK